MNKPQYTYEATLDKITDGDTIRATVDVGFRIYMKLPFRLYGINAPEMNTRKGKKAKAHLIELVGGFTPGEVKPVILKTYKDPEKYGRWLCDVYLPGEDISLNQRMVTDGFATTYMIS